MTDFFEESSLQPIKSISQRNLASYWNTLVRDKSLPPFSDFEPPARLHDPKQLLIWNVDASRPHHSYRALFVGSNVEQVFGSSQGLLLETIVPKQL